MDTQDEKADKASSSWSWAVLGCALSAAIALWIWWAVQGVGIVHREIAAGVVASIAKKEEPRAPQSAASAVASSDDPRAARFAEVGQSGDAFGSLNSALTAIAGALVFWAGYMQHRALRHANEEAAVERTARRQQAADMLKTIQIAERSANAAEVANQLARDTYFATHRPWIKVELVISGPLYYNINGLNLSFQARLTNIGSTPAHKVFPHLKLEAPAVGVSHFFDERGLLDAYSEEIRKRPLDHFGLTIFPGESIVQPLGIGLSQPDLKRLTEKHGAIYPRVLCVAAYGATSAATETRQTASVYEIKRADTGRADAKAKNRSQTAIFVDEGDIPAEELELWRSIVAPGHAD